MENLSGWFVNPEIADEVLMVDVDCGLESDSEGEQDEIAE